ncbi:MAG: hypothetical protein ACYC5J_02145 [Chloroflexota bacterium]
MSPEDQATYDRVNPILERRQAGINRAWDTTSDQDMETYQRVQAAMNGSRALPAAPTPALGFDADRWSQMWEQRERSRQQQRLQDLEDANEAQQRQIDRLQDTQPSNDLRDYLERTWQKDIQDSTDNRRRQSGSGQDQLRDAMQPRP